MRGRVEFGEALWNLLGSFSFSAGAHKIELKGTVGSFYLVADAVQLVKDGQRQPAAANSYAALCGGRSGASSDGL